MDKFFGFQVVVCETALIFDCDIALMKNYFLEGCSMCGQMKFFFVSIVFLFSVAAARGADFIYSDNADGTITVNQYTGASPAAVVPDSIDGKTVSGIASMTFALSKVDVTSVSIPDSVLDIEVDTWRRPLEEIVVSSGNSVYSSKEGVLFNKAGDLLLAYPISRPGDVYDIPDGVTEIGARAFANCLFIHSLNMPDSVVKVGESCFYAAKIKEYKLSSSLSVLSEMMFAGNSELKRIELPDSVKEIGPRAFEDNVLESMTFGSGVAVIGDQAFKHTMKMIRFNIPASVTDIAPTAFLETLLVGIDVDSGNTVYESVDGVLIDKTTGTLMKYPENRPGSDYTVPATVTKIEDNAFSGCYLLENLTIPDGVTDVGAGALASYNLKSVEVGGGVTVLKTLLFSSATSLEKVKLTAVETIEENAFVGDVSLFDIVLPASLKSVGAGAFREAGLTSITIPENVTELNAGAFNCGMMRFAVFDGDAPVATDAFQNVPSDFKFYYYAGKSGFATPQWENYPCVELQTGTCVLAVINGTGSGIHGVGDAVDITADAPPAGKIFDRWQVYDDTVINDCKASTAVLTMPSRSLAVKPLYIKDPAANQPPTAVDYDYAVDVNSVLNIPQSGLLLNAIDPDGDPLTAKKLTEPPHGVLVLRGNGSFYYIPNTDFVGTDSFTYCVNDGIADSNAATVSITVGTPATTKFIVRFSTDGTPGATISGSLEQQISAGGKTDPVTAVAPAGYSFDNWSYGASLVSTDNPLTLDNVNEDIDVIANFSADPAPASYTLAVNSGTGGGTYAQGASVTVKADAPATGYVFKQWSVADADVSIISDLYSETAIVTMPARNVEITAEYKQTAPVLMTNYFSVGQVMTFNASDLTNASLSEFESMPKIISDAPNGKFLPLKVLTKSYPSASVTAVWTKKYVIVPKQDIKNAYKSGNSFASISKSYPIFARMPAKAKLKTSSGKAEYPFYLAMWLMKPLITDVATENGSPLRSLPRPGDTIMLIGSHFGSKTPKVWIEYPDANKGIIKPLKCKVLKPLEFADYKGVAGKSCMDVANGNSKLKIQLPKKWPDGWTPNAFNIVLFNKVGATSVSLPFSPPKLNSISGTVSGNSMNGVIVSLTGDATEQVACDSAGKYAFNNLADGSYTVTPTLAGYSFNPSSKTVTLNNSDGVVDFVATPSGSNNTPPSVGSFSLFVNQDTPENFSLTANDPDGDSVSFSIKSNPAHGTLTGNGADWTYTPDAGFVGNDSFTYLANDGQTDGNVGTVDVVVSVPATVDYMLVNLTDGTSNIQTGEPSDLLTNDAYKTNILVLCKILPGTYLMGSPADELGRSNDETQVQVTLTKPFYLAVFETTQRQYELVAGLNPSTIWLGDKKPVGNICWNDLRGIVDSSAPPDPSSFFGKLCSLTGLDFDLPTSAQWEYACRATTTTALNNGKNITVEHGDDPAADEVAWYYSNTHTSISDVGLKKSNLWGLFDMHGNAAEFCVDAYTDYSGTTTPLTDPFGTQYKEKFVRNGSIIDDPDSIRSAVRAGHLPDLKADIFGFRIALPVK